LAVGSRQKQWLGLFCPSLYFWGEGRPRPRETSAAKAAFQEIA